MTESAAEPTPAERVVAEATARGVRIAVAESLTGGLLADALVSVAGASFAFSGGIVAYDTALKASLLGVDQDLLDECGPVDPEVARQMARGVREACAVDRPADIGVATTGVAGPDADPQTGQPPGTVWIGVSGAEGERAVRLPILPGSRIEVRRRSVEAALEEVLREFIKLE